MDLKFYAQASPANTMTGFLKKFVERSIHSFLGITLGRTLVPDERLNRWLGREPRDLEGTERTQPPKDH